MESLVSIIIPIYNAELYLVDCLESVIKQSYKNLEILLINDGSTDNSDKICIDYQQKDDRIRYFNNSNHGVSYTRNYGISASKGDYVIFIDSDDICHINMVERLILSCKENDTDISICGIDAFYDTPSNVVKVFNEDNRYLDINSFLTEVVLKHQTDIYIGGPYNKIFKKTILDLYNVRFLEGRMFAEDFMFVLDYLKCCKTVSIVGTELYYYRRNAINSLTYKNYHDYDFEKAWNSRERAYYHWENFFESFADLAVDKSRVYYLMVSFMTSMFYAEITSSRKRNEAVRNIKSLLNNEKNMTRVSRSKGASYMEKLKVFMCKHRLIGAIYLSYYARHFLKIGY